MLYKNLQDAIDDGYHYFLRSIQGDYTNSMYKNKKAAEAALAGINMHYHSVHFCTLVLIVDKDL